MKRFCYALDLVDDASLIERYERHHEKIWPEIADSLRNSGVEEMQIYRTGNRLFMIMDTVDHYDPSARNLAGETDPRVLEWEQLMSEFQQVLPWALPGEKWVGMKEIFSLARQD